MAKPNFTSDQQHAITAIGSDILVSAAAGSGKTAVLVERIIRKIVEHNVNVDRLLVVTFTEAAASQMRQRVYKALAKQIKQTSNQSTLTHLRKQQMLLPNSNITTIHSFCLNLIRKYCHLLDLDPSFKVADITQTAIMKPEVLRETFEDWYTKNDANFLKLVEIYGSAVTDDALCYLVLEIYEFSRSCPWPKQYLEEWAGLFYLEDDEFCNTQWYNFLMDDLAQALQGAADMLTQAFELSLNLNIHEKYSELLQYESTCAAIAVKACKRGMECLKSAISFEFGRLPSAKSRTIDNTMNDDEIKELKNQIQLLRNNAKFIISKLRENVFFKPLAEQFSDIRNNASLISTLVAVVNGFTANFSAAKRDKNIVDFSDFEHFCIKLLEDDEIAAEVRDSFDEVMIDEYQDSNLIQETILLRISKSNKPEIAGNRFMVGDIKQSIYRFRMANPDLFREKYSTFAREPAIGQGLLINLSTNFRSCNYILDAINFLFKQLMTESVGEVDYGDDVALHFGGQKDATTEKTEVYVVDISGDNEEDGDEDSLNSDLANIDKYEMEARIVAKRILEFIAEGTKASDIVILLRSPSVMASIFANELARAGITVYDAASKGFFNSTEILTIINLLKIIDNPRQDIPLAAVLYSPIFMFTVDELVAIRRAGQGVYFDVLTTYSTNNCNETSAKITNFINELNEWRRRAVYMPISQLIWEIFHESGYYNFVSAMDGGTVRQANLNRLFEQAVTYEKNNYKGLFHFIKYIEKLQQEGVELGEGVGLESDDAVKIMSIHKSKGLEFPVVFVCGLGRKFNLTDSHRNFTMHRDLGFGTISVDLNNRVKIPTLNHYAIKRKLLRESLSEELRVLYVALTRAETKLILTGTGSIRTGTIPFPTVHNILSATSFMDWILMALEQRDALGAADLWDIFVKTKTNIKADEQKKQQKNAETVELLREIRYNGDTFHYPLARLAAVPSKISVTEVKRLFHHELAKDSATMQRSYEMSFDEPTFITGEQQSPVLRGIVTHAVLERIDFHKHRSVTDISALVREMETRLIIHPKETQFVDVRAIKVFLDSKLAERIRQSAFVRKEIRFVTATPPSLLNNGWNGIDERDIMLHGVIDLVFEENGEMVIVDYKTDRIAPGSETQQAQHYRLQLALYTQAIEKYYGKPVKETRLYFFNNDSDVML